MKRRLTATLFIAALALPLGFNTASANHTKITKSDPNDTDGRLDMVKVRYIGNGDDTATLVLKTSERWKCDFLRGVGEPPHTYAASLSWDINRNRDPYNEKSGQFFCSEKKLFLRLDNGETYRAHRPDRRTARVTIPLKPTKHLSLVAISRLNGEVDGEIYVEEEDVAPDGRLEPYKN